MDCQICSKIKEKQAIFVYEDDFIAAILPSKPAALGHIRVLTKNHYSKLDQMPESISETLLSFASYSSAVIFDVTRSQGTNIILTESDNHLIVDILPRKEGDGLNFNWKPKPGSPDELDATFSKIKDKAFVVGKTKSIKPQDSIDAVPKQKEAELKIELPKVELTAKDVKQKAPSKDVSKDVVDAKKPEESYLLKQLRKIP